MIITDSTIDKRPASNLSSYFYKKSSVSNGAWKKMIQDTLSKIRFSANAT